MMLFDLLPTWHGGRHAGAHVSGSCVILPRDSHYFEFQAPALVLFENPAPAAVTTTSTTMAPKRRSPSMTRTWFEP